MDSNIFETMILQFKQDSEKCVSSTVFENRAHKEEIEILAGSDVKIRSVSKNTDKNFSIFGCGLWKISREKITKVFSRKRTRKKTKGLKASYKSAVNETKILETDDIVRLAKLRYMNLHSVAFGKVESDG
jgi:hypothetical protein